MGPKKSWSEACTRRDANAGIELHLGDLRGLVDLLFVLHFDFLLSVKVDSLLYMFTAVGRETTVLGLPL